MKQNSWLYIGLGALLATAATLLVLRRRKEASGEKPPRKAPQLHTGTPSDQSEFTTSTSGSELG